MDMSGMKDMPGMDDGKGMSDMGNMRGGMGGMSMQGNVRNGEKIARGVCAGCHGPRGVSVSDDYPDLAGQNAMYVMSSLMAYRNKTRDVPAMYDVASRLSDQDIADVAAFYDSLAPRD
jgi:cytochrome c553